MMTHGVLGTEATGSRGLALPRSPTRLRGRRIILATAVHAMFGYTRQPLILRSQYLIITDYV